MLNPFVHALDLVRALLLTSGLDWGAFLLLLASSLVYLPISFFFLNRALGRARQRGDLHY